MGVERGGVGGRGVVGGRMCGGNGEGGGRCSCVFLELDPSRTRDARDPHPSLDTSPCRLVKPPLHLPHAHQSKLLALTLVLLRISSCLRPGNIVTTISFSTFHEG